MEENPRSTLFFLETSSPDVMETSSGKQDAPKTLDGYCSCRPTVLYSKQLETFNHINLTPSRKKREFDKYCDNNPIVKSKKINVNKNEFNEEYDINNTSDNTSSDYTRNTNSYSKDEIISLNESIDNYTIEQQSIFKQLINKLHQIIPTRNGLLFHMGILILNEILDEGVFDISQTGMVQLGQCLTTTIYFHPTFIDLFNKIQENRIAIPLKNLLLQLRKEITIHVAAGTCLLNLIDMLESTASDTWLGVSCVALSLLVNKWSKNKVKINMKQNTLEDIK